MKIINDSVYIVGVPTEWDEHQLKFVDVYKNYGSNNRELWDKWLTQYHCHFYSLEEAEKAAKEVNGKVYRIAVLQLKEVE